MLSWPHLTPSFNATGVRSKGLCPFPDLELTLLEDYHIGHVLGSWRKLERRRTHALRTELEIVQRMFLF